MDNLDFNEAWKKINEEKFSSSSIKKEEIMNAISQESSLTIFELKKRLKYKLYWNIFFVTLFGGAMLWNFNNPIFLSFFAIWFVLYSIAGYFLIKDYRNMSDQIDSSKDTLSEMKKHRDIMKKALKGEDIWGKIAFPILIITMMVFGKIQQGIPFNEFMTDPVFLTTTLILIIVLTIIGNWAAKKMNDAGYGCYIQDLEENIKKMEEL